ncbi:MAG: SH3 domain-containing protein [Spirochaetia bacterium]|nr:SH3 domain-containing protein [Spirochaetia bacterium]
MLQRPLIVLGILCLAFFALCKKEQKQKPLGNYEVTGSGVRIRTEPAVSGKVLGQLTKGDRVAVLTEGNKDETIGGKTARWMKIQTGDGRVGWIFGAFVKKMEDGQGPQAGCLSMDAKIFPSEFKGGWVGASGFDQPPRTVFYPDGRAEIVYDFHRGIMNASWKKQGSAIVVTGAYQDIECEIACMGCYPEEECGKCEAKCSDERKKKYGKADVVFDVQAQYTMKNSSVLSAAAGTERSPSGKPSKFLDDHSERDEGCMRALPQ